MRNTLLRKALLTLSIFLSIFALTSIAEAQTIGRQPFARASGTASVSVKPDQLKLNVGVIAQAVTAQEAASQNAMQMDKVLLNLRQILGPAGETKTVSYSLTPLYKSQAGDGTPILIGYRVANTVEVTTDDLSLGGKLIDAATAAGANSVQGLQFSLRDSETARGEALRAAARQGKARAQSIASGLGMQIGQVVSAEESSAVRPLIYSDTRLAPTGGGSTPVETGMVEVSASVVVEAELKP